VSDESQSPSVEAAPSSAHESPSAGAQVAAQVDERPELAVGAAFGGGLLLALILKRLAS
jgi:hypothetical protein